MPGEVKQVHVYDATEMVLKPCPFCGGEPKYFSRNTDGFVACERVDCYAATGVQCGAEAIAAWNRRALSEEAVRGAAEEIEIYKGVEKALSRASLPTEKSVECRVLEWLFNGEPGISSETIASCLLGLCQPPRGASHPRDLGDFRRCLLLLEAVPEFKERLREVAVLSPEWAALIANWDRIEDSFFGEVPDYQTRGSSYASKTYRMMKMIIEEAAFSRE